MSDQINNEVAELRAEALAQDYLEDQAQQTREEVKAPK